MNLIHLILIDQITYKRGETMINDRSNLSTNYTNNYVDKEKLEEINRIIIDNIAQLRKTQVDCILNNKYDQIKDIDDKIALFVKLFESNKEIMKKLLDDESKYEIHYRTTDTLKKKSPNDFSIE